MPRTCKYSFYFLIFFVLGVTLLHSATDSQPPADLPFVHIPPALTQQHLTELRENAIITLVETNMRQHVTCINMNRYLNTAAQICQAGTVITTTCAGYTKLPWVAFLASGIGVAGMALRGLADYAKKIALENFARASTLMRSEGVEGLNNYIDNARFNRSHSSPTIPPELRRDVNEPHA